MDLDSCSNRGCNALKDVHSSDVTFNPNNERRSDLNAMVMTKVSHVDIGHLGTL